MEFMIQRRIAGNLGIARFLWIGNPVYWQRLTDVRWLVIAISPVGHAK